MISVIAWCALGIYVITGGLVEVTHLDPHEVVLHAIPTLESHECGAHETHIPLDKRHECLACSQSALRVATLTMIGPPVGLMDMVCIGGALTTAQPTIRADVTHSGKRGPPLS